MQAKREILITEKRSKFYGYLISAKSEDEVKAFLQELKKEHKKATHICWACALVSVIQKRKEKDVAIFIVRYFGGVKLGAGGLVRIYTKVASALFDEEK